MDLRKQSFLSECANVATLQAQLFTRWAQIVAVFFDRGYNTGGAGNLTDAQLAELGLTRGQLDGLVTFAQQVEQLRQGAAVAIGDYDSTVNAWRTDV